jgi:ribosomal protein L6P/L9E
MLSFTLPKNIKVYHTPGYLKITGPSGYYIKKTGSLIFNTINTAEGVRLFVSSTSNANISTSLVHLYKLAIGLSRGFQCRLRLVGIGFRAIAQTLNFSTRTYRKNYRRKRISSASTEQKLLSLKIGYSHEAVYPIPVSKNNEIKISRIDGRSKGTLLALKSNN